MPKDDFLGQIKGRVNKFIERLFFLKLMYKQLKKAKIKFAFLKITKHFILNLIGFAQLPSIFICPSHGCNANCVHCYEKFPKKNYKTSLTTYQIKNCIDQFKKLGGLMIHFCSGEFLLRKDALELVKYGKEKNILISITTNGLLLNEEMIDKLKVAGLTHLIVSIDSANPKTHDKLRGVQGCFKKAIKALEIAKKKEITTEIWTYISKSNFDEIEGVIKLGENLQVQKVFVFFPLLSGNLFNKFEENLNYKDREYFRKKYNGKKRVLLEFPKETSMCQAGGFTQICIMPSGDVTFCPPVPYSYGNIEKDTIKKCLKKIVKDHNKFCVSKCTGQCPVNFMEYRNNCNAKFIYDKNQT